jgi:hypothetical protein
MIDHARGACEEAHQLEHPGAARKVTTRDDDLALVDVNNQRPESARAVVDYSR